MNSFIPEEDMPAFEKFLSDNNLRSGSPQAGAVPRPPGGAGTGDAENFLLELNKDAENILTTNF